MILYVVNGFAEIEEEFTPLGREVSDPDFGAGKPVVLFESAVWVWESTFVRWVDEAVDEEVEVAGGSLEEAVRFFLFSAGCFGGGRHRF